MSSATVAEGAAAVLRPLRQSDVEAVARWYDKATVLAGSPVPLGDLLNPADRWRSMVLTESGHQEPVALLVVALDDPKPAWATVALLAIARQEEQDIAALGVALLEARLRGEASHVRASVPRDVGLALYFWLRLGYRPVVSGQGLWMISDLEA